MTPETPSALHIILEESLRISLRPVMERLACPSRIILVPEMVGIKERESVNQSLIPGNAANKIANLKNS